ncbi:MAG: hypothetical protein RIC55_34325 [Pirellulaceae bacterium]
MLRSEKPTSRRGGRLGSQLVDSTSKTISDHLTSSVGVCLGLGFGVGLLIGVTLASNSDRDRRHYYQMAGDYGRKMYDSIAEATPHWLGGRS